MLFFAYFSVSKKRNIKQSRNGMKPTREVIFGRKHTRWTWTLRQGRNEVLTRVGGAPLGRAPLPHGPLGAPPTYFFLLYIHKYPQTIRTGAKTLIPPPQLSVSMRSHLGACPGAPPEEGHHHEGLLHHHSLSDEV